MKIHNHIAAFPLIILAGGKSSRMGIPKGLIAINNQTMLEHQLKTFYSYGGKKALVVLGYDIDTYFDQIPWIAQAVDTWIETPFAQDSLVKVVINKKPELEKFSSLQIGLSAMTDQIFKGLFVLPIDVPIPSEHVWIRLTQSFNQFIFATFPQFENRIGHPLLFSCQFINELINVPIDLDEAHLDIQINKLSNTQKQYVEVDDSYVHLNINTPEELDNFRELFDPSSSILW
ncbi:MAG: NTP transferase domain-containing protein [Bacteriovoracaceae bacterium]|nr:NTP transferase domain-containing protein [Bacteriovoracaceae bacterium]